MFCSKCGQAVEEGVNFCPNCGNNLLQNTAGQGINQNNQGVTQVVTVMPSGTAPLVMGLLGMFGFLIPIVKYFTGLLSLIAIFVGASQRKSLKNAGLPTGKATAGLVLGIIAVLSTIISIITTTIFIGSLFSISKPDKSRNTSEIDTYIRDTKHYKQVTEINFDGTWLNRYDANGTGRWLIVFNGENITISENLNYKKDNFAPKYARRNQGYYKKENLSSGDLEKKYNFIITYTKEWRNGSWKELDNPKEEVLYISFNKYQTTEDAFSLKGKILGNNIDTNFWKERGNVYNYE